MKKKDCQKPTMQVVMLRQRQQLLAGSVESTRADYGEAQEEEWE
jgi:hypothetical protein